MTGAASGAPTVLLADDHPLVRLSVREELEGAGFRVCAEAGTAGDAVEAAVRERPDLCLLDVSMPGSGLAAAAEIGRRLPATRVVMLTGSAREEDVLEAVRVGAVGYLLKEDDPARLPAALRDVLAGVPAFPRRLSLPVLAAARRALGPPAYA
ncbi:MAG TPA: response regulator transcription factor [Gaiellaceae bacterium]|nr:response regulator transcription factor [Gaiellaceae bacterium]